MQRLIKLLISSWVIVAATICSLNAQQPASNASAANIKPIEFLSLKSGKNHTITLPKGVTLDLIWIAPGTFTMGSTDSERGRLRNEGPQTEVTISKGFWLGKTLITQAQYRAVMGNNPSSFVKAGADAPVEMICWNDAMGFCRKLSDRETATGHLPEGFVFTLPTEAQWGYACRAGTTGARYGNLDEIAWYHGNSGDSTHPVGQKQPNAFGLYDMIGNVWELCSDWYGAYPGGNVTDPVGASSGSSHVIRGTSWYEFADDCCFANRNENISGVCADNLGFRLALVSSQIPLPGRPTVEAHTTNGISYPAERLYQRVSTAPLYERNFSTMDVLETKAICDKIRMQDHAYILQAWIDADRVEHDQAKHSMLATTLSFSMHDRAPSPEFLAQMRAFINDPANRELDRQILISALGLAQRRETTEMLLDMAEHQPAKELKNNILSSLGMAGSLYNLDESQAPTYERAWRKADPDNKETLRSVAASMARVGTPSSMELLLTVALDRAGKDGMRRQVARDALTGTTILNRHAVAPLAARLSNDSPTNEASQLAGSILFRMQGPVANRALVAWMQNANASAAPLALNFATNGQCPDLWQAALDPSVPFRSEKNREAIRKGLAAYHAGRVTQP